MQNKAAAEEAERLDGEIASVRSQLSAFSGGTVTGDPQGDLMARLTGIELQRISTGLVVLLVALVEIMSSAGLYIAFGHGEPLLWRRADECAEPPLSVGDVARFALAATREAPGAETDIAALFASYCAWCASERTASLTSEDFGVRWQALSNEVGWRTQAGRVSDLELAP